MKNDYEIRGDVTAIFLKRRDGSQLETLIDTADLPRAMEFPGSWYAAFYKNNKSCYAQGLLKADRNKRITVKLHRWITNPKKEEIPDHINHDTLNNTRTNLRVIPKKYNKQNTKGAYVCNKSGVRGVTWHKKYKKWYANYRLHGHLYFVGSFDTIADAELSIKKARAVNMPYSLEALEYKKQEAKQ